MYFHTPARGTITSSADVRDCSPTPRLPLTLLGFLHMSRPNASVLVRTHPLALLGDLLSVGL
jgi:hypothetical protein